MTRLEHFLGSLRPLQQGRARKALTKLTRGLGGSHPLALHIAVENMVANGARVTVAKVRDTREENRLSAERTRLAETAPIGNPNHPDTRRLREIDVRLQNPLFTEERRLDTGSIFYTANELGSLALDYAVFLSTAET